MLFIISHFAESQLVLTTDEATIIVTEVTIASKICKFIEQNRIQLLNMDSAKTISFPCHSHAILSYFLPYQTPNFCKHGPVLSSLHSLFSPVSSPSSLQSGFHEDVTPVGDAHRVATEKGSSTQVSSRIKAESTWSNPEVGCRLGTTL